MTATSVVAAVPVKPFGVAKRRLETMLDGRTRARLGKEMARRTAVTAEQAGARVVVVTGSDEVASWAHGLGLQSIEELAPSLDGAAAAAAALADSMDAPWLVIHADLPLITPTELAAPLRALAAGQAVLAPARDGGTNVIGGTDPDFPFAYGPGSFHRHLRAARDPVVFSRPGLALDVDRPQDLVLAFSRPTGAWLGDFLG